MEVNIMLSYMFTVAVLLYYMLVQLMAANAYKIGRTGAFAVNLFTAVSYEFSC
jgi:hypothetical protein